MRKKILSIVITGVFVATTFLPMVNVKADPTTASVEDSRSKYEELKNKVTDADEKIQSIDDQISELVSQIKDNQDQIKDVNKQIDQTKVDITKSEGDISNQEDVLGQRLREVYKEGGQSSYVSLIFSAQTVSDLINRIDSAGRIIDLDKKVVQELVANKQALDDKVTSLDTKSKEITKLNDDISSKKDEADQKKAEQVQVRDQAKADQDEFDKTYLSTEERSLVQGMLTIANNSGSSLSDLQSAVAQLKALENANQIKSPTVVAEMDSAISNGGKYIKQKQSEAAAAAKAAAQSQAAAQASANTGSQSSGSQSSGSNANRGATVSGSAGAILAEAYKHLGQPYVYGASGPSTFDCSGFTSYVYSAVTGIYIGRTTYEQVNAGVAVSPSDLQPGDLVFPNSGHVQIYIGNGMVIHAPHTGDVIKIAPLGTVWQARRILN